MTTASRRLRSLTATTCAAALALIVSGCTSDDSDPVGPATAAASATTSAAGASPSAEASYEPVGGGLASSFDRSREVTFPESGVVDAAMPPGQVLTAIGTTLLARSFPDLAEAWQAEAEGGQYVDLRVDEDAGLVYTLAIESTPGSGTKIGSDTYLVARLDLATGETEATASGTLKQNAKGRSQAAYGQIAGVSGDTVLVNSLLPPQQAGQALDPPTAIALDLDSSKKSSLAWRKNDASVLWADDDTILVSTARTGRPGDVYAAKPGSGKRRFRVAAYLTSAAVVGTQGRTLTLATTDGLFNISQLARFSLRTGKPIKGSKPRTVTTSASTCSPANRWIAACSVGDGTLVGWHLAKNRQVWKLPTGKRFAPHVTAVKGGLLFGNLDDGTGVVLDARTGADITPSSGAAPSDVNEYGGLTLYLGLAVFSPQGTTPEGTTTQPTELATEQTPTESASD